MTPILWVSLMLALKPSWQFVQVRSTIIQNSAGNQDAPLYGTPNCHIGPPDCKLAGIIKADDIVTATYYGPP